MFVLEIEFATPEYDEVVGLRTEVLRKPLGLEFTPEQLAAEYADKHFACYHTNNELLGCMMLTVDTHDASIARMRQVAVRDSQQGKGIGRHLVAYFEAYARRHGFREIQLAARSGAVPFYEKLGYQAYGEPFIEVSIPHRHMKKSVG